MAPQVRDYIQQPSQRSTRVSRNQRVYNRTPINPAIQELSSDQVSQITRHPSENIDIIETMCAATFENDSPHTQGLRSRQREHQATKPLYIEALLPQQRVLHLSKHHRLEIELLRL